MNFTFSHCYFFPFSHYIIKAKAKANTHTLSLSLSLSQGRKRKEERKRQRKIPHEIVVPQDHPTTNLLIRLLMKRKMPKVPMRKQIDRPTWNLEIIWTS